MKYFYTFLCVFYLNYGMMQTHSRPNKMQINLENLAGKWWIQYTNFPMWLKGDKHEPRFNYAISADVKKVGLQDTVRYKIKNGSEKSILGFDTPMNSQNTEFSWRGKGLLWLFKSKWQVLYINEDNSWAIIAFSKTIATPKGYDVITKNKTIEDRQRLQILQKLKDLSIDNLVDLYKNK